MGEMNGGEFGLCLGYSNKPCPACGRYRLENYENGKQVCEKCGWCPQENAYVDRERMYPPELHWSEIPEVMTK